MDERLRQTVRERADHRCEYCFLPQDAEPFFAYHVEHIVARQHGGSDDNENLALACTTAMQSAYEGGFLDQASTWLPFPPSVQSTPFLALKRGRKDFSRIAFGRRRCR